MIWVFMLVILLGLIAGSFNALQWRLPQSKTMWGRSECVHCHHPLAPKDLIPVLSFLFLGVRCRSCRKPIPGAYPLTELAMAMLFVLAGSLWIRGDSFSTLSVLDFLSLGRNLLALSVLAAIFLIDLRTFLIPDELTIPSIAVFAVLNLWLGMTWTSLLAGVLVGGGFFLFLYLVTRGRGIGDGDIRLGALMGVLVGWPHIFLAIFFSYMIGAPVAILLLALKKKTLKDPIPFGPFLTFSAALVLLFGSVMLEQVMFVFE